MMRRILICLFLIIVGCSSGDGSDSEWNFQPTESGQPDVKYEIEYDEYAQLEYMKGNCQHTALIAAGVAASYGYEYEVVYGEYTNHSTDGIGYNHVETRMKKDGVWYWLRVRDPYRVELWKNYGEWFDQSEITFEPYPDKSSMHLAEVAYNVEFEWWDKFR